MGTAGEYFGEEPELGPEVILDRLVIVEMVRAPDW